MKKVNMVCVVEDDPLHLFIIKKYISLTGLVNNVVVCKNGKEAYDTLFMQHTNKEQLPEIIFLDINMPVWDGWRFLEEFLKIEIPQRIIIYILTSSNSDEDIARAKKYNLGDNYLIKPIYLEQLNVILNKVN